MLAWHAGRPLLTRKSSQQVIDISYHTPENLIFNIKNIKHTLSFRRHEKPIYNKYDIGNVISKIPIFHQLLWYFLAIIINA